MKTQEYRAINAKNYSMLKDFLKDRQKFYKKYVLGEYTPDEQNMDLRVGSAVDCMLFTPEEFDELFFVGDSAKTPTGKGLVFVKTLFELQEKGGEFMDNALQAYNAAGLTTPKFDTYMEKFEGSNLEEYYISLIQAKTKTVLSVDEYSIAERICQKLKDTEITRKILIEEEGINQLTILFSLEGEMFKSRLDRVVIDHKNKVIKPYDLKCTYEDEDFVYNFLKNRYYLQQGLYEVAIEAWRDENYPDYTIDPFRFIVIKSSSVNQPLVYELSPSEGSFLYNFKTEKGAKYKGVIPIINEINWHIQNNIWDISKENYQKYNFILQKI